MQMQAMTFPKFGNYQVLKPAERAKPVPKDDELLIKVKASSVNKGDWHYIKGEPFPIRFMAGGLFTPKHNVPGGDVAGVVEQVGAKVTGFQVGDEVFGDVSISGFGAWAEYVCAKTTALAHKPKDMTWSTAASIPVAGGTALEGLLTHGQLRAGMHVLVNGASGGVGMFAVGIAKAYGAKVTAVVQTEKVEVAKAMGADHIVDYKQQDVTQNGERYDLILDAAAYRPFQDFQNSLSDQGRYVLVGGSIGGLMKFMLVSPFYSKKGGKQFMNYLVKPNQESLNTLAGLITSGKLTPYVDQVLPLEQAATALQSMDERRIQGKVVVEV